MGHCWPYTRATAGPIEHYPVTKWPYTRATAGPIDFLQNLPKAPCFCLSYELQ
nr:MAG TPA: hypothetical protein [Caudoviricetes sp.]